MKELLRYIDEMERRLACLEDEIARKRDKMSLLQQHLLQSQEEADDLRRQLAERLEESIAQEEAVAEPPSRRKKKKKTPDPNQLMLPFEDWP